MRLLGLKRYAAGYTGFVERGGCYAFFAVRRGAAARILKEYRTAEFRGRRHFIAVMEKFMPASRFLPAPVALDDLSLEALERAEARFSAAAPEPTRRD